MSANLPQRVESITFGYSYSHSIINANLPSNLYYIYDYSNKIEFHESLPKMLYSIIYIDYVTNSKIIKYKREVGKYTKSAMNF
jgi:hypothetical protein